jgi:2-polyprenyl-3-methyl-5-hydroxy-6-metoxy-1,4-benzoquinol methylase/uncharacterized protein YbaR (Trm112 family)
MKLRVLDWLVCPLCGNDLEVSDAEGDPPRPSREVAPETPCTYRCHGSEPERLRRADTGAPCASCYATEIDTATLVCSGGHAFAVRDGVPRLRVEDLLDASAVSARSAKGVALTVAASFEKEWSHFDYEKDRTWHQSVDVRCQLFLKEVATTPQELHGKVVLDAGCGNGSLSRGLNRFGCEVLAADVSESCVVAHKYFAARGNNRTHFVQADLMNPPFRPEAFHVIFSSGVLHHNPDTRQALRAIAKSLAPGGRIYIWVYGHVPGVVHKVKEVFRSTISPMPAAVKHAIVAMWLPQAMIRQYIRTALGRNSPEDRLKWSERFVLLLDHYTPRYRWEHTPEELFGWYRELGYEQIAKTEDRAWGFGVAARKPMRQARSTTRPAMPSQSFVRQPQ